MLGKLIAQVVTLPLTVPVEVLKELDKTFNGKKKS